MVERLNKSLDGICHTKTIISRNFVRVIQFGFSVLYHQAALLYDLIAWIVSGGRWIQWGLNASNLISGANILEIGFGTGHLLRLLSQTDRVVIGLDESKQMCRISMRRFSNSSLLNESTMIVRGLVQHIPFLSMSFDSIICNFPSDYISDSQSLSELHRVLKPGGRLIVLVGAWVEGDNFHDRFASFLFRLIGQPSPEKVDLQPFCELLSQHHFYPQQKWVSENDSRSLYILATRNGFMNASMNHEKIM